MKETLVRPVKCAVCLQPMFYKNDERWTPEVSISVNIRGEHAESLNDMTAKHYVHESCFHIVRSLSGELLIGKTLDTHEG
jgi:hypothetical protein